MEKILLYVVGGYLSVGFIAGILAFRALRNDVDATELKDDIDGYFSDTKPSKINDLFIFILIMFSWIIVLLPNYGMSKYKKSRPEIYDLYKTTLDKMDSNNKQ